MAESKADQSLTETIRRRIKDRAADWKPPVLLADDEALDLADEAVDAIHDLGYVIREPLQGA